METKNAFVLLQKVVTSGKYYVDACLLEDACVICINRGNKKNKFMPFKVMYDNNHQFWLQNETWEYFLGNDDVAKIEKRVAQLNAEWAAPAITETASPPVPETVQNPSNDGLGQGYVDFAALPESERAQRMQECRKRLVALIAQKPRQEQLITKALVETTQDAIMYNYTSLINAMNLTGDDAKQQTQELVDSTRDIVKASSQLISPNIFNDELMNTLVAKSNGTIIQHMTRVYLKGLAFLSYYNKLVSGSSIIKKLRISFNEKYFSFYSALLPHIHLEDITLERVFLGGMRAIPEPVFYNWAIGFLVHDIGKASAVEYHEGEAAYNRDIVTEHVKVGYSSIMNKTNYPRDAGLITGYHHEYYGDPSGYGFYRICLDQYKKINPQMKLDYCISYEVEPVIDYQVLAFFPAKILEIVDVFDSLTDPNRKYRKAVTTDEALALMDEEFIIKHRKIDIILFDLFKRFVKETPSS
jgi:HD-GYP domain-containing protein (c-di-GMP phosphodiesterase class II)